MIWTGLKGGVDGFSYFNWFSVISFSNQNHPCDILKLVFVFTADEDFDTSDEDDNEKDNTKIKREKIGNFMLFELFLCCCYSD